MKQSISKTLVITRVTILENLHLFADELGQDKTIDLIVPFVKEIVKKTVILDY
jgi:hypothetical protein